MNASRLLPLAALAFAVALGCSSGEPADAPPADEMVFIPAGEFWMGSDLFPDAKPVHRVRVDGFWIDATEVTNEQFAYFVKKTGYVTIAERQPDPKDFPDVPAESLAPFSGVFTPPAWCPPEDCKDCQKWWTAVRGASWRKPTGPGSDLKGKDKYPVVHVAWEDAVAYAEWAGKHLPTEAEWEYAARGGLDKKLFYWGDELKPDGKWMANVWQGHFPCEDAGEDGFAGLAPVKSYPPNGYGLYDVSGNAWEWCADWYRPGYDVKPGEVRVNPKGPESSKDTHGRNEPKRVQRGGSFLCSDTYCLRYRAGGRMEGEPKTGLSHTGFRCVRHAKPGEHTGGKP
jgi:sulfatase modifying factor 1